ncbi:MAG: GYF domain-containing protein [Bdellovibrionales bacterium]|nr:GYF domain-containing protein [Bdellovibrionales bacterium]
MYMVSRNGETLGPWAIDVIAQKLAMAELAVTDFAWDEKANDWVTLMEFGELKTYLHSRKPKAPAPRVALATATTETAATIPASRESTVESVARPTLVTETEAVQEEWYISRGQQKFGPFSYLGVIKALQDKSVFEFDYIWTAGMDTWIRIAEHEKFATETIRTLLQTLMQNTVKSPELVEVFAQRKHPRLLLENDVLVHDNSSVSAGRMVEASVGGSGLIVKNSTLVPGQTVNVHFASIQGLPAFNAVGEVVSKKFVRSARDRRAPIHYGIRFVKMDSAAEMRVKNFFKEKTGRAAV